MVYESDFYTTRRPYSRPTVTSYTVTRREVDWSKHPTVARPSQVSLPYLAFARRAPLAEKREQQAADVSAVARTPACLRHSAPRSHSRLLFEAPHPRPLPSRLPDLRHAY